jgi:hypothetical protein
MYHLSSWSADFKFIKREIILVGPNLTKWSFEKRILRPEIEVRESWSGRDTHLEKTSCHIVQRAKWQVWPTYCSPQSYRIEFSSCWLAWRRTPRSLWDHSQYDSLSSHMGCWEEDPIMLYSEAWPIKLQEICVAEEFKSVMLYYTTRQSEPRMNKKQVEWRIFLWQAKFWPT